MPVCIQVASLFAHRNLENTHTSQYTIRIHANSCTASFILCVHGQVYKTLLYPVITTIDCGFVYPNCLLYILIVVSEHLTSRVEIGNKLRTTCLIVYVFSDVLSTNLFHVKFSAKRVVLYFVL